MSVMLVVGRKKADGSSAAAQAASHHYRQQTQLHSCNATLLHTETCVKTVHGFVEQHPHALSLTDPHLPQVNVLHGGQASQLHQPHRTLP